MYILNYSIAPIQSQKWLTVSNNEHCLAMYKGFERYFCDYHACAMKKQTESQFYIKYKIKKQFNKAIEDFSF